MPPAEIGRIKRLALILTQILKHIKHLKQCYFKLDVKLDRCLTNYGKFAEIIEKLISRYPLSFSPKS